MATVLYVTAEVLRAVGILAQPFVPGAADKLLALLSVPAEQRELSNVGSADRLEAGKPLPQPEPIFPRYLEAEA
jgi:methionyl-tRNA synthetase